MSVRPASLRPTDLKANIESGFSCVRDVAERSHHRMRTAAVGRLSEQQADLRS